MNMMTAHALAARYVEKRQQKNRHMMRLEFAKIVRYNRDIHSVREFAKQEDAMSLFVCLYKLIKDCSYSEMETVRFIYNIDKKFRTALRAAVKFSWNEKYEYIPSRNLITTAMEAKYNHLVGLFITIRLWRK